MINGKTLIDWGFKPGKWFGHAIEEANMMREQGGSDDVIRSYLREVREPTPPPHEPLQIQAPLHINLDRADPGYQAVVATMQGLLTLPTAVEGALMPDACPAGTIPVGGVVATRNAIHPGFHSADICCSVAIAVLGDIDPKIVLDRAMDVTHFGPGGRTGSRIIGPPNHLYEPFLSNRFLNGRMMMDAAQEHFATQGDGNHFLYVGRLKSDGRTAVVTHHGSRKPGALLYKAGMEVAERHRLAVCPEAPKGTGWIPFDTDDGETYWAALQTIREWTRESHHKLHSLLGFPIQDWMWNEHNFVFQRDDLFYHAKGATPGWNAGLVPLNMAEPILMTRGTNVPNGIGFLPHGAGRHYSRTAYLRDHDDGAELQGIDARWFSGIADRSELPGAYKPAAVVRAEIARFGLADIFDEVLPYGSIMAGDWLAPYRKKKG